MTGPTWASAASHPNKNWPWPLSFYFYRLLKKGGLPAEISRLARSTLQVLEIMKEAASVEVAIHVVKNAMVMNGSTQSKIYATIVDLAAAIERDFISQRTREGLARCKVDGIVLGRPRGVAQKLGLDDQARKIDEYQALKLNKRAIAKLLGVSANTLYAWLRRRRPETVDTSEIAGSEATQPTI